MWARATRVEIIIVSVVLLVLFMCSKPPKSGRAEVDEPADESAVPASFIDEAEMDFQTPTDDTPNTIPDEASEEISTDSGAEEVPPPPRVGAVDARGLDKDVMYGEITVRWVWNGTRFVPRKVCVVEEPNGVTSVWSFDQQGQAVLSELSDASESPR